MGFVASIMDDARFNYVAQPEDGMDPSDLIPKLGPYDKFAVTWGYKPVPSAKTPDQEKPVLDQIVKDQETKTYLRFSTEGASASDPGENAEAVGDSDAGTGDDARHEESEPRGRDDVQSHELEGRRPVGRPRIRLRPHGQPVEYGDGPTS